MDTGQAIARFKQHGLVCEWMGGTHIGGGESWVENRPRLAGQPKGTYCGRNFVLTYFAPNGTYVTRVETKHPSDLLTEEHATMELAVERICKAFPKIFGVCALLWHPSGDKTVLAVSRRGNVDDLGLPGGKVDPGETPVEAIIREVHEETGLTVRPQDLEWVYDRLDSPTETWKVARCFLVKAWSGDPSAMEEGFSVRWAPISLLTREGSTFGHYNLGLFKLLGELG